MPSHERITQSNVLLSNKNSTTTGGVQTYNQQYFALGLDVGVTAEVDAALLVHGHPADDVLEVLHAVAIKHNIALLAPCKRFV